MKESMQQFNIQKLYFAAVLLFLIYLLWIMMRPFLGPILFGTIISGSLYPVFNRFLDKTKLSRRIAAIIMCFLVFIVIFIPTIYLLFVLSKEALSFYKNLTVDISNESLRNFFLNNHYIAGLMEKISSLLGVEYNIERFINELISQIKFLSSIVIVTINNIVKDIVRFCFDFIIMILVIYTLLAEGVQLKAFIFKLSPLPDAQEALLFERLNQMNFVTLVCNGLGGLIQGILAGIGFWIAGINLVVLWTSIMIILAFIPLVGISIIYIPACIYLIITGKTITSILLFIYCSLIAIFTENWFKPLFIGNKVQINSLFVLFTIIGGMTVFGFGGIFYGPLIAILFMTMVELYHKFYSISS